MSPLESKLRHMALGAGPTIECTQAADRIAELEKELEIASAFSHWVVIERDKLRIENAKLEKAQEWVAVGFISKNAEKFLRLGNNMCDVTILYDSGDHNCIPVALPSPPQTQE